MVLTLLSILGLLLIESNAFHPNRRIEKLGKTIDLKQINPYRKLFHLHSGSDLGNQPIAQVERISGTVDEPLISCAINLPDGGTKKGIISSEKLTYGDILVLMRTGIAPIYMIENREDHLKIFTYSFFTDEKRMDIDLGNSYSDILPVVDLDIKELYKKAYDLFRGSSPLLSEQKMKENQLGRYKLTDGNFKFLMTVESISFDLFLDFYQKLNTMEEDFLEVMDKETGKIPAEMATRLIIKKLGISYEIYDSTAKFFEDPNENFDDLQFGFNDFIFFYHKLKVIHDKFEDLMKVDDTMKEEKKDENKNMKGNENGPGSGQKLTKKDIFFKEKVYNLLATENEKVYVSELRKWKPIKKLIERHIITDEMFDKVLCSIASAGDNSPELLTFKEFSKFMDFCMDSINDEDLDGFRNNPRYKSYNIFRQQEKHYSNGSINQYLDPLADEETAQFIKSFNVNSPKRPEIPIEESIKKINELFSSEIKKEEIYTLLTDIQKLVDKDQELTGHLTIDQYVVMINIFSKMGKMYKSLIDPSIELVKFVDFKEWVEFEIEGSGASFKPFGGVKNLDSENVFLNFSSFFYAMEMLRLNGIDEFMEFSVLSTV